MKTTLLAFFNDESGNQSIEYGLIASLIAIAVMGGATAMGGSLSTLFASVSTGLR